MLVLADWLDDHEAPAAAAAIRDYAQRLFARYRAARALFWRVVPRSSRRG